MTPASEPVQRPAGARVMVVDPFGQISDQPRSAFVDLLHPGDLVIANDAATIPASLSGVHLSTGQPIEIRLAGLLSLDSDVREFAAVVFGAGDYRVATENRPLPPRLAPGDRLELGSLSAEVVGLLDHPRLIWLRFDGSVDAMWADIAHHGRPIQYSHVGVPLAMWHVWTPIAGMPAAFEAPSAGFALSWETVARMRTNGVRFMTITHAAGLSSTGDPELDLKLPFDEPYSIPQVTVDAIQNARYSGGRIVAVGTTVVRALEHAGHAGEMRAGKGIATQRIGVDSCLRVVDAILSGAHEPGTSHYELLRAFVEDTILNRLTEKLNSNGYRTHEFGDSVLIWRTAARLLKMENVWPMRISKMEKAMFV
jgi:S-adenosylmethionine:tRNA ribosyltransferase-isomerase